MEKTLEKAEELYQKLKGSIFLRLALGYQVRHEKEDVKGRYYPRNVWGEEDFEILTQSATVELKRDMTFAEFCSKWGYA